MASNPTFEIHNCQMRNMRHDTGDDMILWYVEVKTPTYPVQLTVWFDNLQNYCKEAHPEIHAYINSIRKGIIGLGPKHGRVMDVLLEEGFEPLPLIKEYIQNECDLERYHRHDLKLRETIGKTTERKKLEHKTESLRFLANDMKGNAIRLEDFTDQVMEYLGTEVAQQFPEIFNAQPELIEAFHTKLVDWMLNIKKDIGTLSFKAQQYTKAAPDTKD